MIVQRHSIYEIIDAAATNGSQIALNEEEIFALNLEIEHLKSVLQLGPKERATRAQVNEEIVEPVKASCRKVEKLCQELLNSVSAISTDFQKAQIDCPSLPSLTAMRDGLEVMRKLAKAKSMLSLPLPEVDDSGWTDSELFVGRAALIYASFFKRNAGTQPSGPFARFCQQIQKQAYSEAQPLERPKLLSDHSFGTYLKRIRLKFPDVGKSI